MKKKVFQLFLLLFFSQISANANTVSISLRVVMPDLIEPQINAQFANLKTTNAITFVEDTTKDGLPAIIETTIVK
ncbi:MAG: hypothetical protein KAI91_03505 [Candidatus Omnitrophica bacterium]|nr:hypothetical protein [Candidatus Omnitrophota bacterium]